MNSFIDGLNLGGERLLNLAWPMLWQSSLLIAVLFLLDFVLRRRVRAAVRYALWLVVLVKLLLPPSLALPTAVAWWLRPNDAPAAPVPSSQKPFVVRYGAAQSADELHRLLTRGAVETFRPELTPEVWLLSTCAAISLLLTGILLWKLRTIRRRLARGIEPPDDLQRLLSDSRRQTSLRPQIRLLVCEDAASPAVCGLLRPVIFLPRGLVDSLSSRQLRAVLLHELIHVRRGDVWVNCAQALLQIVFWWHPLLWLANARIRRLREEAVDDAVLLALADDAETYAPTLLEVAKLAFSRPPASLGLVGILESRSALRQRIERLIDFRPPRKAGLTIASALSVLAFAALAAPMGQAPLQTAKHAEPGSLQNERFAGAPAVSDMFLAQADSGERPGSGATPASATNQIVIEVHEDGGYWLGTGQVDLPELRSRLSEAKQADPSLSVRLKADQKAPFTSIVSAVDLCKELGISRFAVESVSLQTKSAAAALVQEGKLLFESGDLDAAEAKLMQAINADPENKAAFYYLSLVKEARYTQAGRKREPASRQESLPVPRPHAETNPGFTGPGRQAIVSKLDGIRLDKVSFDGLPLSEVLHSLSDEVRKRDPERRGINFLINLNGGSASPGPADLSAITVTIKPELTDVRLADLLDAIVKGASTPVKYSIQDFGVVFSPITEPASERLHTRVYNVDPNTILQNLAATGVSVPGEPATGTGAAGTTDRSGTGGRIISVLGTNGQTQIWRSFLARVGVDLADPAKAIFFNDRAGKLFVRATQADQDAIETALATLNTAPPQINVKARFIEMTEQAARPMLGNVHGTNSAVTGCWSAILTAPASRALLEELQAQAGVDLLATPEVTTLSGREAQIQIGQTESLITLTNGVRYTNDIPVGPVLDILPTVTADGYAIQMKVTPTVTEFLGYDDPGAFVPGGTDAPRAFATPIGTAPIPRFRVRTATADAVVGDGQTLVLGNLATTETPGNRQVPPDRDTMTKQVLVFITPTIIDAAGNRVHTDEELRSLPNPVTPPAK